MIGRLIAAFRPSGLIGTILFIAAAPLSFSLLPRLLAPLLPDALYYTPFTFYAGDAEITPLTVIVPLIAWPCFNALGRLVASCGIGLFGIFVSSVAMALFIAASGFYLFAPPPLLAGLNERIAAHARLAPGHPKCYSSLIETLERCEGRDRDFMQSRLHAIAHYGQPVADVKTAIKALPNYDMAEVPCTDLIGGTVGQCFTGHYMTEAKDNMFKNVYIFEHDGRILVLDTANIVITTGDLERQQRHTVQTDAELRDYVDLSRFDLMQ